MRPFGHITIPKKVVDDAWRTVSPNSTAVVGDYIVTHLGQRVKARKSGGKKKSPPILLVSPNLAEHPLTEGQMFNIVAFPQPVYAKEFERLAASGLLAEHGPSEQNPSAVATLSVENYDPKTFRVSSLQMHAISRNQSREAAANKPTPVKDARKLGIERKHLTAHAGVPRHILREFSAIAQKTARV